MQWSYEIVGEPGIVRLIAGGPAEMGGFAQSLDRILADPAWHPAMNCVADFRQLDLNTLKHDDVVRLADLHIQMAERIGNARIAIVVSRPVDFGMVRMWQAMVEERFPAHSVFYDMDDAMRWLKNPDADSK